MKTDTDALIREALSFGFDHAGGLNMESLVFMPEVREMCAADRCRQYGKNWRCPPACGSLEDAAAAALKYSHGVIVQTVGYMEDDFDYETMESTMKKHQESFASFIDAMKKEYADVLPMGAGTCNICARCTYPNAPCRFPGRAVTSMEAFGLMVSGVCEMSGMPYHYGERSVTYTSCCLIVFLQNFPHDEKDAMVQRAFSS